MTEISISRNEEEQEQEINIKEFLKTQKQFLGNMQFMFQKHATATRTTKSNELHRSRIGEKDSHDESQQESCDRNIPKNTPGASRKRKRVYQHYQIVKIES